MTAVLLTLHVLIVLGLIGVVLLQRSDGGALGIGGGGGGGGLMSGRGAANALTRMTSVLAALFFGTSLTLAVLAGGDDDTIEIIEELTGEDLPEPSDPNAPPTAEDLFQRIGGDETDTEPTADTLDAADEVEAPAPSADNASSEDDNAPAEAAPENAEDETPDN